MKIICVDNEELIVELVKDACLRLPQHPEVFAFTEAAGALDFLTDNEVDIALLDIRMPEMDGLTLAQKVKDASPDTAIIFLTGYSDYAVDAFAMHVSGYLMKPIDEERLRAEVDYALSGRKPLHIHRIVARTFGEFDLLVDGVTVSFERAKSKELLAYLIDRRGGNVTRAFLFAVLFEEKAYDRAAQKYMDVIIRSLRKTLSKVNAGEILEMSGGLLRVLPEKLECDMYRFMDGDINAINSYRGEYMSAYSWASLTEARIDNALESGFSSAKILPQN
ncbi:MAG: response regulator [Blautia sp.]|nr:response regulator [Blautia sp.]